MVLIPDQKYFERTWCQQQQKSSAQISRLVTEAADLHSSEFKDFIVEYYGKNRESEDTSDEDSEEFEDAAATETKSGMY